jgi:hypothetical protein
MGIFRGIVSVFNNRKTLREIAAKIKQHEPLSQLEFDTLHLELRNNSRLVGNVLHMLGYSDEILNELENIKFKDLTRAQTLILKITQNKKLTEEDETFRKRMFNENSALMTMMYPNVQEHGGAVLRTKLRW